MYLPVSTIELASQEHVADSIFHNFHQQLFHSLLSQILNSLHPAMSKSKVIKFKNGHYCHVIYGLDPYIADYEEQILLAGIVQSWCAQ